MALHLLHHSGSSPKAQLSDLPLYPSLPSFPEAFCINWNVHMLSHMGPVAHEHRLWSQTDLNLNPCSAKLPGRTLSKLFCLSGSQIPPL